MWLCGGCSLGEWPPSRFGSPQAVRAHLSPPSRPDPYLRVIPYFLSMIGCRGQYCPRNPLREIPIGSQPACRNLTVCSASVYQLQVTPPYPLGTLTPTSLNKQTSSGEYNGFGDTVTSIEYVLLAILQVATSAWGAGACVCFSLLGNSPHLRFPRDLDHNISKLENSVGSV